jgi:DNA (cytosine-5)-methyltransferase 1
LSGEANRPAYPLDDEHVYRRRQDGGLLQTGKRFRLIDLYAGPGCMTSGFSEAFGHVFRPVFAFEPDPHAAEAYLTNFDLPPEEGDLIDMLKKGEPEIPAADAVVGRPPLRGFSLTPGRRARKEESRLWRPFMKVVSLSGARVFLMECPVLFIGGEEHENFRAVAERQGFKTVAARLQAADYGVPQVRRHAFILGSRTGEPRQVFPPLKTHYQPGKGAIYADEYVSSPFPWRTVEFAVGHLPSPEGFEPNESRPPLDLHFHTRLSERVVERMRAVPEQGAGIEELLARAPELVPESWKKGKPSFGRLRLDRPAPHVGTEFHRGEKSRSIHPLEHRPLTFREAARLQSFRDDFVFSGPRREMARQIGSSAPPLLAARLADSVYALLASQARPEA